MTCGAGIGIFLMLKVCHANQVVSMKCSKFFAKKKLWIIRLCQPMGSYIYCYQLKILNKKDSWFCLLSWIVEWNMSCLEGCTYMAFPVVGNEWIWSQCGHNKNQHVWGLLDWSRLCYPQNLFFVTANNYSSTAMWEASHVAFTLSGCLWRGGNCCLYIYWETSFHESWRVLYLVLSSSSSLLVRTW